MVSLHCCQGMLLAHVQLAVHQDSRVLFSTATHQASQSPAVSALWDNSIPGVDVYLC